MSLSFGPAAFDAAQRELVALSNKRKYVTDPVLWAYEYLGISLWSKQREILYAIRDNRNVAVAAGHGVGKSFVAAVAMAWWIDVHPLGADESGAPQTFVASTAPFQEQISAILWNNLRILHGLSKKRYKAKLIDHFLPGYITGDNKWKLDDGTLIGQGRKPPDNKEDSGYQGLHATYMLAIGDEAAGLSEDMVTALGNITTAQNNRLLLIANPTDPSSEMAKIWRDNNSRWHTMHISVYDSPNITNEAGFPEERRIALSGQDYIDEKLEQWGEDDPRFLSRVLGQWAFDAGNTVFTEFEIAQAGNTVVLPDPEARRQQGWDIARMGGDATIGYQCQEGDVWVTDPETSKPIKPAGRRGLHIRKIDSWTKAPLVGRDPENLGSAQRVHTWAEGEGAAVLNIDASGLGSGVIDGLADIGSEKYVVVEVFGGAASTDKRAFVNMRAEQYFELKRKFFAGEVDIDPKDSALLDDLRGIIYEPAAVGGGIKIESKESMKKRGKKSPDNADAFWYAGIDLSELLESPLAGLEKGDRVVMDPYEMLQRSREEAGVM